MRQLWARFCLGVGCLLLMLSGGLSSLHAQEGDELPPMPEAEFWGLMLQTQQDLTNAIPATSGARAATLAPLRQRWEMVKAVQLADGTVIPVDMRWLHLPDDADTDLLQTRQQQVTALLDYQARRTGVQGQDMYSALAEVLRDPRFHYRQSLLDRLRLPSLGGGLGLLPQLIILGAGILVVGLLLLYLVLNLRRQPAQLAAEIAGSDIPPTAAAADSRAAQSVASGDYRSAIRYLYLSSLLWLDEHQVIHFDSTQTNYEHLRQLRERPQQRQLLATIVDIFDRVWYGFAPADDQLYRDFQQVVEQLKRAAP